MRKAGFVDRQWGALGAAEPGTDMVRRGLEKLSLALVRCPLPSPGIWRPPCQSGPHRQDPLPEPIPRALPALAIISPHPPHLTAKSTPHTPAGGSAAGQAPGLPVPRPSYCCCFCSPSTDSPCWPGCGGLSPTGRPVRGRRLPPESPGPWGSLTLLTMTSRTRR